MVACSVPDLNHMKFTSRIKNGTEYWYGDIITIIERKFTVAFHLAGSVHGRCYLPQYGYRGGRFERSS